MSIRKRFFLTHEHEIGRTASEPLPQAFLAGLVLSEIQIHSTLLISWGQFILNAFLATRASLYVYNGKNVGCCCWRRQEDERVVDWKDCWAGTQRYIDLDWASWGRCVSDRVPLLPIAPILSSTVFHTAKLVRISRFFSFCYCIYFICAMYRSVLVE